MAFDARAGMRRQVHSVERLSARRSNKKQASDGSIYDRALVNPDRNNIAPRVGVAYSVTPKTVIRSAYGMSYIHFNRLGGENLLSFNGPHVVPISITQQPSQGFCASGRRSRAIRRG